MPSSSYTMIDDRLLRLQARQALRRLLAQLLRYGVERRARRRPALIADIQQQRRLLQDLGEIGLRMDVQALLAQIWPEMLRDLAREGLRSYQWPGLEKFPWSWEQVAGDWLPDWDPAQEIIGEALLLPDQIRMVDDEVFLRGFLRDNPVHAQGFCNLAVRMMERNDETGAERLFRHALQLDPDYSDTLLNYGVLLTKRKQFDEAISLLRHALEVRPDYVHAFCNLGFVLAEQKQYVEAEQMCRRALELEPDNLLAMLNITVPLHERKAYVESEAVLRRVLSLAPEHDGAAINLMATLVVQGKRSEAEDHLRQWIERHPASTVAMSKLGLLLSHRGAMDEAEQWLRRAYAVSGNDASAGFDLAIFLLLMGKYPEGFQLYEHRFGVESNHNPIRFTDRERWDGGDLRGKRILVHAEQGLGDLIQCVRFLSVLQARGARVILETRDTLLRLFQRLPGVEVFVENTPIPEFDLFAPIMSLPYLCGMTVDTLPGQEPYLSVDPQWVTDWAPLLPQGGLRVAVVWAANPISQNHGDRSLPLAALAPLLELPGVHWISVQKGEAAEAELVASSFPILPLGEKIGDFADTAAILRQVDLVLSIDTSVVHLAGALGIPTWVPLHRMADWRWLHQRPDSPWYPSVRLFRQVVEGDWQPVIEGMREELRRLHR